MSRLGKKPIEIPTGVEVKKIDGKISVKGPLGCIERSFRNLIDISIESADKNIKLKPRKKDKLSMDLWGTYVSHLKNMITGVVSGFSKTLIIEGIGYKAMMDGRDLVLSLGLSHPVKVTSPSSLEIKTEKNKITISGIDKELVGQITATIRALKKPEPYKGKGIRYEEEIIKRKAGKKAAGSA